MFDVIIVGGGLSGLTLAALLGRYGLKTACIDRETRAAQLSPRFDGRTTAISYGSMNLLKAAGVWGKCAADACPINDIRILDAQSPTLLQFLSQDVGDRAFGWIVDNLELRRALLATVDELPEVEHIDGRAVRDFDVTHDRAEALLDDGRTLSAGLIVGADGRGSFTRTWMGIGTRGWTYNQRAIVCAVFHEHPHHNVAVEHFRAEGPFAILPMTDDAEGRHRSSLVWTEHGPEDSSALHVSEEVFNAGLAARFPADYGAVRLAGPRAAYPLGLVHAHRYIGPRMALVAEAAHGIHPIAGQGLNMGFRDLAALTELVVEAARQNRDIGAPELLARYQRLRRFDNMAMAAATDGLNRLFSNNIAPVRLLRQAGVGLVSRLPQAKQFFMRQAMGAGGALPRLIRGEEL